MLIPFIILLVFVGVTLLSKVCNRSLSKSKILQNKDQILFSIIKYFCFYLLDLDCEVDEGESVHPMSISNNKNVKTTLNDVEENDAEKSVVEKEKMKFDDVIDPLMFVQLCNSSGLENDDLAEGEDEQSKEKHPDDEHLEEQHMEDPHPEDPHLEDQHLEDQHLEDQHLEDEHLEDLEEPVAEEPNQDDENLDDLPAEETTEDENQEVDNPEDVNLEEEWHESDGVDPDLANLDESLEIESENDENDLVEEVECDDEDSVENEFPLAGDLIVNRFTTFL